MTPANHRVTIAGRGNIMRLRIVMFVFLLMYGVVAVRLATLGFQGADDEQRREKSVSIPRPEIVDRTGAVLALDLPSYSIVAEPRRILDADEAAEALTVIFPDLESGSLRRRLSSGTAFTWIKRNVTAEQKDLIWKTGIPGIGIRTERRRTYPNANAAAHVLGTVNIDNAGISGIERWIDDRIASGSLSAGADGITPDPIQLTIDLRVQHALSNELSLAMQRFSAIAAAGLVLDVTNGEVIALVSLPDFDPNQPSDALRPDRINRIAVGTYEMGSTFKAMTTAMALDSGAYNIRSVVDASLPLRFGRMVINDYRGQNRPLTVPEAFVHSSNIAMGRMAMGVGGARQQAFFRGLGLFDRLTTELPENARPIVPARWSDVTTATTAFGHGIAVTPLQASMAIASLVNGGLLIRPTFIKATPVSSRVIARERVTPETGETLRFLLRLNAEAGSASKANLPGYFIGGKTGTSEKVIAGKYSSERVLTAFMGIAPADNPRYLFLTVIDEPKASSATFGFRTSGWNAVPTTGSIMKRVLPLLDVRPYREAPANPFPTAVRLKAWGADRFAVKSAGTTAR